MFEFGILRGGSEFDSGRPQKKLKSWWGGETGIWPILVVDSKYGSAVKKTHKKTLHCGKQPRKQRMRGARPGVPKWRALPLKKEKKKYQSSPRAGFEPGTRRPVVLLLTHYTTLPYNNKKWTVHQTRACKGSRGYRPAHYTPQSNKKKKMD